MKEYIKLYQKMREEYYQKWGEYAHPQNWQEFEEMNQKIFDEHLKEGGDDFYRREKIKLYIQLILERIRYFGYYSAFCEGSFEGLNNAIWQNGRVDLLEGGVMHSGAYGGSIIEGIFTCFACNDFEVIKSFVPPALPLLQGTSYTDNAINLLYSIYYKDSKKLEESISKAESFLTKKKLTGLEESYVRFFLFVAAKDVDGIGESLQKLCEAYQKQGYPIKKIDKCFVPQIHGLYRSVRLFDESLFEKIKCPTHKCFLKEFEVWQQKNNFPKGKPFYEYPEKLSDANRILQSSLPMIHFINVNRKLMIDAEKFTKDLSR
ncbi:hypothetical protein EII17_06880 [Clostridiales bacterium COT073_COT-073]|nr:hypothetical protein EII17_06880 [Clostridiales bacterium COT073_COT-073]